MRLNFGWDGYATKSVRRRQGSESLYRHPAGELKLRRTRNPCKIVNAGLLTPIHAPLKKTPDPAPPWTYFYEGKRMKTSGLGLFRGHGKTHQNRIDESCENGPAVFLIDQISWENSFSLTASRESPRSPEIASPVIGFCLAFRLPICFCDYTAQTAIPENPRRRRFCVAIL